MYIFQKLYNIREINTQPSFSYLPTQMSKHLSINEKSKNAVISYHLGHSHSLLPSIHPR